MEPEGQQPEAQPGFCYTDGVETQTHPLLTVGPGVSLWPSRMLLHLENGNNFLDFFLLEPPPQPSKSGRSKSFSICRTEGTMLPTLPKGGLKTQREQPEGRQSVLEGSMPSTRFDAGKLSAMCLDH